MSSSISGWQRPNLCLLIVAIYLFVLAATAVGYTIWAYDGISTNSFAATIISVIIVMISLPIIAGILLIKRVKKTSILFSLSALIVWLLIIGYVIFSVGSTDEIPLSYYITPMPFGFPFVSSFVMIALLYIGWRGRGVAGIRHSRKRLLMIALMIVTIFAIIGSAYYLVVQKDGCSAVGQKVYGSQAGPPDPRQLYNEYDSVVVGRVASSSVLCFDTTGGAILQTTTKVKVEEYLKAPLDLEFIVIKEDLDLARFDYVTRYESNERVLLFLTADDNDKMEKGEFSRAAKYTLGPNQTGTSVLQGIGYRLEPNPLYVTPGQIGETMLEMKSLFGFSAEVEVITGQLEIEYPSSTGVLEELAARENRARTMKVERWITPVFDRTIVLGANKTESIPINIVVSENAEPGLYMVEILTRTNKDPPEGYGGYGSHTPLFINVTDTKTSSKTGEEETEGLRLLPSQEPDKIIQIEKNKEITITNADSSTGETFNKAIMTVNNVTFYREQHPTENISIKPGFGTLFFNYTIKNIDDTAYYAHVDIEAIVEGKRFPYQLVSGAMGELLLPGENKGSWIAFQVPKETETVIFELRDSRTQNIHWNIGVNLLQN